jgi:hypothetical protein
MLHTYNPSYSGGWNQKVYESKPTQANRDPISKISNTKKDWWSGSSGRVPA